MRGCVGAGGVVSGEGGPTRCNIPYAKCRDAVVEQVEQRIRLGGHGSSFLVLFDQLGVENLFLRAGAGGAERGRGGGGGSRRREEERGSGEGIRTRYLRPSPVSRRNHVAHRATAPPLRCTSPTAGHSPPRPPLPGSRRPFPYGTLTCLSFSSLIFLLHSPHASSARVMSSSVPVRAFRMSWGGVRNQGSGVRGQTERVRCVRGQTKKRTAA